MNLRIVHKTGWILLAFAFALLFAAERGTERSAVCVAGTHLSLTVSDAAADEMRCARSHNSDPNLPARIVCASTPVQTLAPGPRCGQGGVRPSACGCPAAGSGDTGRAISRYRTLSTLPAGATAADYYVFRLRRLII